MKILYTLIGSAALAAAAFAVPACAQQGASAIRKLSFMQGTWHCVLRGGPNTGFRDTLSYSFSPNGNWMIEQEGGIYRGQRLWSLQMWGYDPQRQKLVAYQFTNGGVATKSVTGWQNGLFVSQRDDNNATVSIRQHSKRAFDWIIQSPDKSQTATQVCTRS